MIGAVRGALDSGRPPYLSHFALREAPFSSSADSRFFYADAARQQCLGMLQHLAEYGEEWLLVSGPSGIGKGTLLNEFIARAESHVRPCRIDGGQSTDGAQLFLNVSRCFGLDLASHAQGNPLDVLRQHLNTLQADQVPVVAVDRADRLSDDALEIILHLADLEGDHGKLVRVVLFADQAILKRLTTERFSSLSKPHLMELHPFDEGETARYLVHRISVAGFTGANPFDAKAVRQIFKESEGLPARINSSADRFLRQKMAAEKGTGRGNTLRKILVPVAALAAVGGIGFVLQGPLSGLFGEPLSADESLPNTPVPAAHESKKPVVTPLAPTTDTASIAVRPLLLREGESVQISCSPLEKESSAPPANAPQHAAEQAQQPSHEPVASNTFVPVEPTAATPAQPGTVPPIAAEPHVAPVEQKTEAATGAAVPTQPSAVHETPSEQAATEKSKEPPKPVKAAKVKAPALSGVEWFKAQPLNRFTLQLIAANQPATIDAFLKRRPLNGAHATIETEHNGAPLHTLVFGSFASKEAAAVAARQFGNELQPWPRTFGDLRANVKSPRAPLSPPASTAVLKDNAWVGARDPRHFALQLVGAEQEQAIWNFAGKQPLPEPTALVTIERGGKPWYVLLHGDFSDHAAAVKAHGALPAHLRQGTPFVREFKAFQAASAPRDQEPALALTHN